jgi:hypothetical protein
MTLRQQVLRLGAVLVEAHVRVAFVSGGRARPIPKPLRIAMQADQETGGAARRPVLKSPRHAGTKLRIV